jgi:hypothetical protein
MGLPIFGKKMVVPSDGDTVLRCGTCGCTSWTVHVHVGLNAFGAAQVTNVICDKCLHIFKLSPIGQVGGNLTRDDKNQRERRVINARHDT